jgi:hypothetical protein
MFRPASTTRALLLTTLLLGLGAQEAAAQCSPQLVGNLPIPAGDTAWDVAVSGSIAYVITGGPTAALLVVDISDPTNPVQLGSISPGGGSVEVFGSHVYKTSGPNLDIIDVSNPASPSLVSSTDVRGPNTSSGAADVVLSADGTLAYTICSAHPSIGYFAVTDVSNPASPTVISTLATSNFQGDITLSEDGTTVWATAFQIGVTNPAAPTVDATFSSFNGIGDVRAFGNTPYYCNNLDLIALWGVGTSYVSGAATALVFSGDRGYTISGSSLRVLDMSGTPTLLANVPATGNDLAADGGYVYVADGANGLDVYDVTSCGASLELNVADCQDDADPSSGYQVAVELDMNLVGGSASGFVAFVDYDMATFSYRGDLSTYAATPFTLHISPIAQADDGLLELDGTVGFSDPDATADALLATLVFDVLGPAPCGPVDAMNFETGGAFPSKLSLGGTEIATNLLDPEAYTLDDTDPVFDAFSNITQAADASLVDGCAGAIVTFTDPTATDNCSTPTVVSVPASGSFFATGTTQVTSTATDACGNSTDLLWDVTVTSTNVVHLEVELVGVDTPVSRCIRLQTDDCTISDFNLSFTDHDLSGATPVRAQVSLEIPCGEYLSLCTKDAQHTKWGTSTLSIVGPDYVADTLYSLDGGDTDDDGDVDIDDVTLFLAQFGTGPFAGGCPWDGTTRDTDFSNNGAIAAEDYVFLTSNWLTQSFCSCTIPSTAGGGFGDSKRVTNAMERRVDFDRNGRIDYRDVMVFEKRHGLPHTLSAKMRGH